MTTSKEIVQKVEQPETVKFDITDAKTEMKDKAKELSDIEGQLINVWQQEMKLWVQTYLLMKRVEDEKLFEAKGYHSFSAWVNALATEIIHVHVSLLWKRLKAGRAYTSHILRAEGISIKAKGTADVEKRRELVEKKLTETNLSPDSLVLIDKITKGNPEEADKLIEKAEAGELRNRDLQNAWQEVREARADKKRAASSKTVSSSDLSSADVVDIKDDGVKKIEEKDMAGTSATAKQVVDALRNSIWMQRLYHYSEKQEMLYETPTFGLLTEFSIYPPETRQARRIDALIVENYSVDAHVHDEIVLHGIEIKVSESDLIRDTKMGDYALYVDRFWVAVPDDEKLVAAARDYIADGWGLLIYNVAKQEITVDREAKQGEPRFRDKALMTLARKLMQGREFIW